MSLFQKILIPDLLWIFRISVTRTPNYQERLCNFISVPKFHFKPLDDTTVLRWMKGIMPHFPVKRCHPPMNSKLVEP